MGILDHHKNIFTQKKIKTQEFQDVRSHVV